MSVDVQEPDIDLDIEAEPDMDLEAADAPAPPADEPVQALAVMPLVQVLPADFPLPTLIRFVPDQKLRVSIDEATVYALGVKVDGRDGLVAADAAAAVLRASLKAAESHFEEPIGIANQLHKNLTGTRGEWLRVGQDALKTIGSRIYNESRRLEQIEADERRKAQAEADRIAREEANRRADEARKANAPKAVVENLTQQAATAKAAPVQPTTSVTPLRSTTTVENWKATLAGTPRDAEPNPDMAKLTPDQVKQVHELMRAVLAGQAPLVFFDLNWGEINRRAKAEKTTFACAGLEAFDAGGVRAKGSRSK